VQTVREWKAEIRGSEPWFVYLHLMDPHEPYVRREPWFRAPGTDSRPMPEKPAGWSREKWDEILLDSATYDSEIRFLDTQVQELFELLAIDEHTLVVFLADHGEEFGDHGGRHHNNTLYSELTHIPFFIHRPGVEPRREAANVSQVDVLPTLRELLGAPRSEQDTGTSLLGLCTRGEELPERVLFGQRRARLSELQSVVYGDYKYIVTDYDEGTGMPQGRELYDVVRDPRERVNLVEQQAELAARLDARLRQFDAGARKWQAPPQMLKATPELMDSLDRLGYGGDGEIPEEIPKDLKPIIRHRREKAAKEQAEKEAKAEADIQRIRTALDDYALRNGGRHPDSLEALVTPDAEGRTYLALDPVDPWGNTYAYEPPREGSPARVLSYGADGVPGGEGEDRDIDGSQAQPEEDPVETEEPER
jgi:type II secretion system protein G